MLTKTLSLNRLAVSKAIVEQNVAAMSTSVNIRAKFEDAYLERKVNLSKGVKKT